MPNGGRTAGNANRNGDWLRSLAAIGKCLDGQGELMVLNGGIVTPNTVAVSSSTLGKENDDEHGKTARRPETRPRQRTPGWQGPSGGPWTWSASAPAPVVSRLFEKQYQAELNGLGEYYPEAQLWHQEHGVWILCKSKVLDGLFRHALFLVGVSYAWLMVRSWAFWTHELAALTWIGPRHTNFGDGSICAYEPSDETWRFGDSLVRLLDLYSVWAARHLHLETFGTWPGLQVSHFAIERIVEQRDNELCGCGASERRYAECCKSMDLAQMRVADAVQFALLPRSPPASVLAAVRESVEPPRFGEFLGT